MNKVTIFDLAIDAVDLSEAVVLVLADSKTRTKGIVVTPNVDHIVKLSKDKLLREIYKNARFVFADGAPLVWASKILSRKRLHQRVTGADLLPGICEAASKDRTKIFFLGGEENIAMQAAKRLTEKYHNLCVVGTYCPPFGFERDDIESMRIVDRINKSEADILFIGVGAPKQEKWVWKYYSKLNVGPILCVGAAFDFVAGSRKRAPKWVQKIGMEWFFRFLQEPKRMFRRYFIDDLYFFVLLFKEYVKKN